MTISDIIGKGKTFEPPFTMEVIKDEDKIHTTIFLKDARGTMLLGTYADKKETITAKPLVAHIVKLLNREHDKRRRMCLRNKTKVCDLCHECDIDVLNPVDLFAGY